ncbi:MAG: PIN domain-containing protein [Actinobacteria bacterium]|nr:PIN domain-containing protein [Actinomycetota bacterium]
MLVDANVLLYAADSQSPFHAAARDWLGDHLSGSRPVGFPWESVTAFVRVATHPRASPNPLQPEEAWAQVLDWLSRSVVWSPVPTERHADVLGSLIARYRLTGNHVPDAHLAALAVEHGLSVASADTDFARFTEIHWINPLADA